MRVFLFVESYAPAFGPGIQTVNLARELNCSGHDAIVFTEAVQAGANQYLDALKRDDILVSVPSPWIRVLERLSWSNNLLLALLLPIRLALTPLDMALRQRSFVRSWQGVRGRLNRYLPSRQLFKPLRKSLFRRMSRHHKARPADLVHTFSGIGSVFDWAAIRGLPLIYNENAIPSGAHSVDWWSDAKRHAFNFKLVVTPCSAAIPSVRTFFNYRGKIEVIPCMLADPTIGRPRSTNGSDKASKPLIVGNVARLSPEKGHAVLLHAWRNIQLRYPAAACELWLAGDGPERDRLEMHARGLPDPNAIRFLGHLDLCEIEGFWSAIDIFVLPSYWEGLPNAIIEAMAHAKLVIATNVGGVSEVVSDGVSGVLVAPGDAEALSHALVTMIRDGEMRMQMGKRAQEVYRETYVPEKVIPAYIQAYEEVISRVSAR